jgi:hypothetical protein
MIADEEAEYLSRKARKKRAQKAGKAGGKNHPKKVSLPDDASGKLTRDRTKESRQQAAAAHNVSERKVRVTCRSLCPASEDMQLLAGGCVTAALGSGAVTGRAEET